MAAERAIDWLRARRTGVLACLGYALFLAANATVVWGGVFPFLPLEIQTPAMTSRFFTMQASAFALRFIAGAALAYARPQTAQSFHAVGVACLYALGWSCLIALSYLDDFLAPDAAQLGETALTAFGGALVGWTTASFFLTWQCLFAAQDHPSSHVQVITANVAAPAVYLLLCLIPQAVTALLVAFVIMPLFSLCAVLVGREVGFEAPMFADVPRERPNAYKLAVKDYWRSALCVGSVAFSCGVIRALAVESSQVASVINIASMVALLLCALGFLKLWRTKPLRLNTTMFFRVLFPALTTAFILLPVLGLGYLYVFAACLYAVYACAVALTMIQCAQASHDRGINPVFLYGFVAGTAYGLHDMGFLFGSYAQGSTPFGLSPTATASLVAIYMLGVMFFLAQGGLRTAASPSQLQAGRVELVPTGARRIRRRKPPAPVGAISAQVTGTSAPGAGPETSESRPVYADKIAKQCDLLRVHFKLTDREAQIVEDIARGYTMGAVAEHLGLSDNTVRTHAKHIYAKLDIHKKQQLIELVRTFDPSALPKE